MFDEVRDTLIRRGYWSSAPLRNRLNLHMKDEEGEGGGSGDSGDDSSAGDDGDDGDTGDSGSGDGDGDSKSGEAGSGDDDKVAKAELDKVLKESIKRKQKIRDLEAKIKQAEEAAKRFEGIDPDEIKNLFEERRKAEEQNLEKKGEWDRLKNRLIDEHKSERSKLQEQLDKLASELNKSRSTIETLTIGSSFDSSNFIKEELTLGPRKARVVYGQHFDIGEDGQIVGYDKPRGSSERTPLVDANGDNLSFDAALKKLVESDPDKDLLLKSKRKAGAGSGSETGTAGRPAERAKAESSMDRIRAGLKSLNT